MSKIHKFSRLITDHKYIVTISVIILIIGFIDDNSLWNRRERQKHIQILRQQKNMYENQYKQDTKKMQMLHYKTYLERFAREKYHMKHSDEDVFIIE